MESLKKYLETWVNRKVVVQVRDGFGTEEYTWDNYDEYLGDTMNKFKSKITNSLKNTITTLFQECVREEEFSTETMKDGSIITLYLKK